MIRLLDFVFFKIKITVHYYQNLSNYVYTFLSFNSLDRHACKNTILCLHQQKSLKIVRKCCFDLLYLTEVWFRK